MLPTQTKRCSSPGFWKRPDRFAIGAVICLFSFVATLNLLNPDAMIVRKNLQRYKTIGHLDLEYLTTLSADAVPSLIKLAAEIENQRAPIRMLAAT